MALASCSLTVGVSRSTTGRNFAPTSKAQTVTGTSSGTSDMWMSSAAAEVAPTNAANSAIAADLNATHAIRRIAGLPCEAVGLQFERRERFEHGFAAADVDVGAAFLAEGQIAAGGAAFVD